jgi:predicted DNA-binding transcriptional regulator AlpA
VEQSAGLLRSVSTPRFIRLRDAPAYLGMDKNRFNREVRPLVTSIPIGTQGIAFDRIELDAWADNHKEPQRASRG